MSGDNLYPTIDSMSVEDIIRYLQDKRGYTINIDKKCSCRYPITRHLPTDKGKICQKCAMPIDFKES